jgi:hypothetical protein
VAAPAAAQRVVALAEGLEQVGQSVQRVDHPPPVAEGEAEPEKDDEQRQRPAELRAEIAGPDQQQGDRPPGTPAASAEASTCWSKVSPGASGAA